MTEIAGMPAWLFAFAALPAAVALIIWATLRLEAFVLFLVTAAFIFPAPLLQPAGLRISAADILLVVGVVAWFVSTAVRGRTRPWLRGNPFFVPAVLYFFVNVQSFAWTV